MITKTIPSARKFTSIIFHSLSLFLSLAAGGSLSMASFLLFFFSITCHCDLNNFIPKTSIYNITPPQFKSSTRSRAFHIENKYRLCPTGILHAIKVSPKAQFVLTHHFHIVLYSQLLPKAISGVLLG